MSSKFEEHLKFLADNYNCISLSTLSDHLQRGWFEPYSVVVTFDDGYRNNFTNAFPLLIKYRIPATIFITTKFTDSDQYIWSDKIVVMLASTKNDVVLFEGTILNLITPEGKALAYRHIVNKLKELTPQKINEHLNILMNFLSVTEDNIHTPDLQSSFGHLTWKDIKNMLSSGLIEIGSHGVTHTIFSRLTLSEARNEIEQSKVTLNTKLAELAPVRFFAYPNGGPGDYTKDTVNILKETGYQAALTTAPKHIYKSSDRYELPRICIGNECDLNSLRYYLSH